MHGTVFIFEVIKLHDNQKLSILKLKEINDVINELDYPIITCSDLNQYWLIVDRADMLKSLTLREAFTNWLISFYVFTIEILEKLKILVDLYSIDFYLDLNERIN